jgi:hypothetical protein
MRLNHLFPPVDQGRVVYRWVGTHNFVKSWTITIGRPDLETVLRLGAKRFGVDDELERLAVAAA